MLSQYEIMTFVATSQPERAKAFYRDVLGLKLVEDAWWALVFEAGGRRLYIEKLQNKFTPQPFTAVGWRVPDIRDAMEKLSKKGVTFERPEGLQLDDKGAWSPDKTATVCWFKDPDGNTISLTQFA
jgi:catechol 2,3-dioxygenase-like lactoylglutathione lyase family enzyme